MTNFPGPELAMPSALRDAVARDLRPVRPLARPWQRAAIALPLALVLLVAAPLVFGIRPDATRVGLALTWGVSVFQLGLGMALVAMALREAVPGRALSTPALVFVGAAAIGTVVIVTFSTWLMSPRTVRAGNQLFVWALCFGYTFVSALPLVLLSGLLAARAYPLRPALVGALYGLGAGLVSDGGWRLFCHFTDPLHVLPAHFGAVIASMLAGILLATALRPREVTR